MRMLFPIAFAMISLGCDDQIDKYRASRAVNPQPPNPFIKNIPHDATVKFPFLTTVKITSGFWRGQIGVINSAKLRNNEVEYNVFIGNDLILGLKENQLELSDEPFENVQENKLEWQDSLPPKILPGPVSVQSGVNWQSCLHEMLGHVNPETGVGYCRHCGRWVQGRR